ncbi:MAG TPA: DUF58 domain-containing protein [Gaiellaceae bacterium]|nr:DUF58 domain-containing protein [Gaiellaceae bacterium]
MTREASPKVTAYAALGGIALIAALVTRRPELAALGAPFLLLLAAGLLVDADPGVRASVELDRARVLEGDEVTVAIEVAAARTVERLEVLLETPPGLTVVDGDNPAAVRVAGGSTRTIELRLRVDRWGAYSIGDLTVRARDALGLFSRSGRVRAATPVKAYPEREALRRLLRPAETQLSSGDELARTKGEGLEFADLRPFAFGDRIRRINWRASARRGELWVNEQHPERNVDVVLFVDSFSEVRHGSGSTLDLAVRAAATLAAHYAKRRDRVGLVSFGGYLRWLEPGGGLLQLYRIVDALLDTEITLSHAWKAIDHVPARTLPPQALVVALTPLIDERSIRALLHLRARGFDLDVIELSPVAFVEEGPGESDRLAYRLWRLQREALRSRFHAAGVAVVEWRDGDPLARPIEEVTAFRRNATLSRA